MCGAPAAFDDITEYLDVCNWTTLKPVTFAKNPYHLYGCAGDWVELAWDDANCYWEVIQVSHHEAQPPIQDLFCDGCGVSGTRLKQSMAIQQCLECGETEDVELLTGIEVDVVEDVSLTCDSSCAAGSISYKKLCLLCTAAGNDKDDKSLPMVQMDVVTGIAPYSTSDSTGSVLTCGINSTKTSYCVLGCSLGGVTGDGIAFSKVSPVSQALFTCDPCPSLQVNTIGAFVLCVDQSETEYAAMECVCEPCESSSAG